MNEEIESPVDELEAIADEPADAQLGDAKDVTYDRVCYTLDCRGK